MRQRRIISSSGIMQSFTQTSACWLLLSMLTASYALSLVILSKAKDLSAIAENGKALASSQMRKPSSQRLVAEGRMMACTSGNNANDAADLRALTP